MAYGRPLKSNTRRVPITIYAPIGTLDIIDQYVETRAKETGTAYSRSDFYNDAATSLLHGLDIDADDSEYIKSASKKAHTKDF